VTASTSPATGSGVLTGPRPGQDTIITDDDEQIRNSRTKHADQAKCKTPAYFEELRDREDNARPEARTVTYKSEPFTDWARVDVQVTALTEKSLRLEITVRCNPAYMCYPHDLVPVFIERATDDTPILIDILEPTPDQNVAVIDVTYPLAELARVLKVTMTDRESVGEALTRAHKELGVTAQWLANRSGVNGPNHFSGGILEKGGSGKIFLRPRTEQDFKDVDKVTAALHNGEWNMAEKLTVDRGRPVYLAFRSLLEEGAEMATTLEAESEYEVSEATLAGIVRRMDELATQVDLSARATGGDRPPRPLGIWSMEKEERTYVDSYYDLVSGDQPKEYPLLANGIVLRWRSVPEKDPDGTYLFAVKGGMRTFEMDKPRSDAPTAPWVKKPAEVVPGRAERIRLAAQVHLIEKAVEGRDGANALKAFLIDDKVDNAFARVLQDALTRCGLGRLLKDDRDAWQVRHVMTVTSRRVKFKMKLEDGTIIEFSADTATGALPTTGIRETIHSFELGVGHPGLTAGSTPAGTRSAKSQIKRLSATQGLINRPYHIPGDLFHKTYGAGLVLKPDFVQFCELRDGLITYFGLSAGDYRPGGYKASVLAQKLGLVSKLTLHG
jgi:hypothetical protein